VPYDTTVLTEAYLPLPFIVDISVTFGININKYNARITIEEWVKCINLNSKTDGRLLRMIVFSSSHEAAGTQWSGLGVKVWIRRPTRSTCNISSRTSTRI
jgi:hypothetical protein